MPIVWVVVELMIFVVIATMPVVMIVIVSFMVVAMGVYDVDMVVMAVVADDASGKAHCRQDAEPAIQGDVTKAIGVHCLVPF
jgi:hypothetical protein